MKPQTKELVEVKQKSVAGLRDRDVVINAREIRTLCEELVATDEALVAATAEIDRLKKLLPPNAKAAEAPKPEPRS